MTIDILAGIAIVLLCAFVLFMFGYELGSKAVSVAKSSPDISAIGNIRLVHRIDNKVETDMTIYELASLVRKSGGRVLLSQKQHVQISEVVIYDFEK